MLQPKDKDQLNGYKIRPLYMLSTRDPPQTKGHMETESEGQKKYFTQMETKRRQEQQYSYQIK